MKERHFTYEELTAASPDRLTYMISTLVDLGAPIKLKSLTKTPITQDDFEVTGNLEEHHTVHGEVTFRWGDGNWFE